jgi:hypothetical protein
MKLTDIQLVLLSAASQREDHAIEFPANLKGGAADMTAIVRGPRYLLVSPDVVRS